MPYLLYLQLLLIILAVLFLLALIARFIQPEMIYAVRRALTQVKSTKAFLNYYANRSNNSSTFPDILGDDLRFETRDSDEEDVLSRVSKIREQYRVQVRKHLVPGVKKHGKPQICIVELAGLLVNLGRDVMPEERFRYATVDAHRLLKFVSDEVRGKMGQPPLEDDSGVEEWFNEHPISIEQVIEILISAVCALSYRQRVQVKTRKKELDPEPTPRGGAGPPRRAGGDPDPPPTPRRPRARSSGPRPADARPIRVFVSYCHRDKKYLGQDSLLGALAGLASEGVEFWSDREITAGERWDELIRTHIEGSDIGLLLLSQAYLDSSYCVSEARQFTSASEEGGPLVVPVMLSRCEWELHEWLRDLQFIPGGGKNIEEHYTERGKRKALFVEIRKHLRRHIESIRDARRRA